MFPTDLFSSGFRRLPWQGVPGSTRDTQSAPKYSEFVHTVLRHAAQNGPQCGRSLLRMRSFQGKAAAYDTQVNACQCRELQDKDVGLVFLERELHEAEDNTECTLPVGWACLAVILALSDHVG